MAQRREANGTWTFYGRYFSEEENRKINYKRRGFKTKREAKIAEVGFRQKVMKDKTRRITVDELIEEYHKDAPSKIKESTIRNYKRFERTVISPSFGHRDILTLNTNEITRWINDIFNNGYNGIIYGYSSTRNILLHLSGLLTYAVDREWLLKNPCKKIKPPSDPNLVYKENIEENYWTIDEYHQFIETVNDSYKSDLYEFMFKTGLRMGEFCALQWKDIDLDSKKLRITKSFSAITSVITSP